jgi:hypothetical protein
MYEGFIKSITNNPKKSRAKKIIEELKKNRQKFDIMTSPLYFDTRPISIKIREFVEIEKKILERKSDFQKFVSIQENYADYTIRQVDAENHGQSPTGIEIHSERHLDVIRLLAQNYIDFCGDNSIKFENLYSGNIVIDTRNFKAEHVASILRKELVDFKQLFPNVPKFSDGNEGIFQALVFLHLDSQRRESDFLNYEA